MFRVWIWFKVWEYHLSTKAVPSQYYPFRRSKYSTAQTTLRQLEDNLDYIYIYRFAFSTRTKKNERSLLPKRKEEDQYHHHHFLCFVSQRNDAPFSSIDFTIGNNLTAYTNELDL